MADDSQVRDEKRKQQKRDIRSACGCALFFIAVIVALAVFGPLLRHASVPHDGSISIANFDELAGGILYIAAFTLILLFAALRTRSTARALIGLLIVAMTSAAFSYGFVYRRFVGGAVDGNDVRLSFVWPRPQSVIDVRTIRTTEIVRAIESEGDSPVQQHRFEITTDARRWVSQPTSHQDRLDRLQEMVERARLRTLPPPPNVTICGHAEASTTDFETAAVIIDDSRSGLRITIVIPPANRQAFVSALGSSPARAYLGKTICATGTMSATYDLLVTQPSDVNVSP